MTEAAFPTIQRDFQEHSGAYIALGVGLAVLGVLAILLPFLSGITAAYLVGGIVFVAGAVRLVSAFWAGSWGAGILGFALGVLGLLAGLFLLFNPAVSLLTLTILLAVYFLVHGVSEIVVSLRSREHSGWGWLLASGIASVILGILIWAQFPTSALWAVGLLLGIQLLFGGFSLIGAATVARHARAPRARVAV